MKVLDLFCGAGGTATGLRTLGLDAIGFDAWPTACESHHANGHRTVCADLDGYPWRGSCDLLWASPPCQPFSAAGDHAGADDDRDGMPAFLHAVRSLRPPVVVMENVKGLTFTKHRRYLAACTTEMMRLGYDLQWRVLNAADYGVPQTRERLIVIARADGGPLRWPKRTHGETGIGLPRWVSMADALGWSGRVGFPRVDDKGTSPDGYRERDWFPAERAAPMVTGKARSWVLNTSRDWKPGGSRDDAQTIGLEHPAPTVGTVPDQWQFRRPATTIAGDDAIRVTVEQAAALQGFPPGYVFTGSRSAQFQQVGNAVPPPLAAAVVGALLEGGRR